MGEELDLFRVRAEYDVEVEKKSLDNASKLLDSFYKKYNDKSLKVDTKDMANAVKQGVSEMQKIYKKGMDQLYAYQSDSSTQPPWFQAEAGLEDSLNREMSTMRDFFKDVKVLFSDKTIVSGLDNILSKSMENVSIVAVDLGERVQYLQNYISDTMQSLKDLGAVSKDWRGSSFVNGDMSEADIENRISLLKRLISYQAELEAFSGQRFNVNEAPLGTTTEHAKADIGSLERKLRALKSYNDLVEDQYKITTEQLAKRRKIKQDLDLDMWDVGDQNNAKSTLDDDEAYQGNIDALQRYIQEKRNAIQQLKDLRYELFRIESADEIQEMLDGAGKKVTKYETFLQELKNLKAGVNTSEVPTNALTGDLSEVVTALGKVEQAVKDVVEAFKPLTDALADKDSAISAMVNASIGDLQRLQTEVQETFKNIETLSNKEFNVQNVYNTKTTQSMLNSAQIDAYKAKAEETLKIVSMLHQAVSKSPDAGKILFKNGTPTEYLRLFSGMYDTKNTFNDVAFTEKIAGSDTLAKIKKVVAGLDLYKNAIVEAAQSINLLSSDSIDLSILDVLNELDERVKNSGKIDVQAATKKPADDSKDIQTNVETDSVIEKITSLRERATEELSTIRGLIESTFDFSTISPDIANIQPIVDNIYQQFTELQTKIKALDFSIEVPANGIDNVIQAIVQEGEAAAGATPKKNEFTEANKRVTDSMKATGDAGSDATDGINEGADAAVRASKQIQNAYSEINKSVNNKPLTINGTSYKDFQNFAMKLASSNNMKIDDISVIADGEDNAKLATIKMVNEELAQSIVYTYRLKDTEEESAVAYLEKYKASSNVNKALKNQLAAEKKAAAEKKKLDKENAKNNEWLIKQQGKLDTQERKYKYSKKSIDGSTVLTSSETSLGGDAEHTIEELANHIRNRIKNAVGGVLTDDLKQDILNDIRILQNEIAVAQNNKYSATNMRASSVKTNKKVYEQYLNALESNAKKYGVFDAMVDEKDLNIIVQLREELNAIGDTDSAAMDAFIDNVKVAVKRLQAEKAKYSQESQEEKKNTDYLLSKYKEYADAEKRISKMQNDPSGAAHENAIADAMEDSRRAQEELLSLGVDVNNLAESELATQEQKNALLEEQIKLEKELRNIESASSDKAETKENREHQKYGKTIFNRENRYAESIEAKAVKLSSDDVTLSADFTKKIEEHKTALKELNRLRGEFEQNPNAFNNEKLKQQFQQTTLEVEMLRRELLATFNAAQKFDELDDSDAVFASGKYDPKQFDDAKMAMVDFATEVTNGQFKLEGFNAAGTEMYGTLDKGAGVIEEVTIALKAGTTQMHAYSSGTKTVATGWQKLTGDLKGEVTSLVKQYVGIHEAWQAIKQGATYVKEIDTALTELKKVTDETDASYNRFLQTMSKSANAIGSTVKDLTTSAADWARLGYTMEEAGALAENTAILMNVSEFDNITNATDTLVSALQAYKNEGADVADLSMDIINKYNEVGNNYAISTSDLANSLTRSSATLVAAGNTLSESIAMTTAANATIQDPNAVGKRIADVKNSYIG